MLPSVPLIGNASLDAGGNAARTRARAAVEAEIATVPKLVDSFVSVGCKFDFEARKARPQKCIS
jgi:hypothetical protein